MSPAPEEGEESAEEREEYAAEEERRERAGRSESAKEERDEEEEGRMEERAWMLLRALETDSHQEWIGSELEVEMLGFWSEEDDGEAERWWVWWNSIVIVWDVGFPIV